MYTRLPPRWNKCVHLYNVIYKYLSNEHAFLLNRLRSHNNYFMFAL